MGQALIVSNILLWLVVAILVVVVLALVRQIGVLHERVAPVGALMIGRGPRVGETAPPLELADLAGRSHAIGGAHPDGLDTLIFFLSPSCPVCKTLLPVLRSVARSESSWLRLILASDGPRDEHERFVEEHALGALPYVLSAELGITYQVGKLPYAVLVDASGVIRSQGLVNSREHLESLFEAKERGVESIQEFLSKPHERKGAA